MVLAANQPRTREQNSKENHQCHAHDDSAADITKNCWDTIGDHLANAVNLLPLLAPPCAQPFVIGQFR
jgi:hypothetical protein